MDNMSRAKSLAIEIARCSSVREAFADVNHPCHLVVSTQKSDEFRQLPEPWYGNIVKCKVLFISSNPSIDENQREIAEVFPTESWEDSQIGSWAMNRVMDGSGESGVSFNLEGHQNFLWKCVDGKFRGQGANQKSPQATWNGIHNRAVELLGTGSNPATNYALTEVVHCKSKDEIGVKQSATHCSSRWMDQIIGLSEELKVVVLVGAQVRDSFAQSKYKLGSNFGSKIMSSDLLSEAKQNSFVSVVLGKRLLFVYLPHPAAGAKKTFISKYGEVIASKISSIATGKIAVPVDTDTWFNYLSS